MVEPVFSRGRTAPSQAITPKSAKAASEPPHAKPQGDRLLLGKAATSPATASSARPTPIAPDGHLDYYRKRHLDFEARHPELSPPSYYLNYGDVYVRRFTEVLSPELSTEGQAWMGRARKNLQVAIEDELARNPNLEKDDAAFTAFAYATHSRAYLDAGLTDLPIDDLIRVAVTPNLSDTLNAQGIAVIAETAEIVAREKLAKAMDSPSAMAQEVLNTLKTSPDLVGDVVKLLATAENARTLLDGLAKLKAWPGEVTTSLMTRLWEVTTDQFKQAVSKFRSATSREREMAPAPAGAASPGAA